MSIVPKLITSPLATLLGAFKKPKKPEPVALRAAPGANALSDALQKRTGAGANQATGSGGAESNTSPKKRVMGI